MDADRQTGDDVSHEYVPMVTQRTRNSTVSDMENWLASAGTPGADKTTSDPATPQTGPKLAPVTPPPLVAKTEDPMGQLGMDPKQRSASVGRNIAEIPGAAVGGVEKAIQSSIGWAIDPLANWLNDHVADLSYSRSAPQTMTGNITEGISQFLTGFIPGLKGMKALGMGPAAASLAAGFLSDFATRDAQAGRLSDLWKQAGLPPNVLTDYLSHPPPVDGKPSPQESEIEGRFKNALEGLGIGGALMGGIELGARALRAARGVKQIQQTEEQYLKAKYGEVTPEDLNKTVGDVTAPVIETVPSETAAAKVAKGAADTANLAPRSVIRNKAAAQVAPAIEPEVELYHGTRVPADTPLQPSGRGAVYFTDSKNVAQDYAIQAAGEGEPNVRKVFVRPGNTFDATSEANLAKIDELVKDDPYFNLLDTFDKLENPKVQQWLKDQGYNSYRFAEPEGNISLGVMDKARISDTATMPQVAKVPKGGWTEAAAADAISAGKQLPPDAAEKFPALVKLQADRAALAAKGSVKLPDSFDTYINFARIDSADQVKFVMGKMADAAKGSIDEATRGSMTQEATKALADDMGMTVEDLLSRQKGQPFNAETAVAARQLWTASADRLLELAKVAAGKNAGALDQLAFRRQMAVHAAIQNEVIGARTETARALASWAIPVNGSGVAKARAIDQMIEAMGGTSTSQEMARRLAILGENGASAADIGRFAQRGALGNTVDAVREAYINGLLSNPKTHIVNSLSNTLVMVNAMIERQLAAGIRGVVGGDGVAPLEAAAQFYGMTSGVRDAFRFAAKALKTGETGWTFNKVEGQPMNAISSDAYNIASDTTLGRGIDLLGTAVRMPQRLLGAADEFFKAIGYRMELHAQAVRQATREGLSGEQLGLRTAQLVNNPTEAMMINSADAALYQTFTNEVGGIGEAMMTLRNKVPATTLIIPFIRTPVNIARYALERTPFAPLVSQWRADVAAGGARSDMALARTSLGTLAMLQMMDLTDKGLVTGSGIRGGKDQGVADALQREGFQPYSFKVGNRWVSYTRADPFGMTLGFAASIAEQFRRGEVNNDEVDEWHEVVAMVINTISQAVLSKTYLQGLSNFFEVMTDPQRYSKNYVDNMVAGFLPMTSLNNSIKNFFDPVRRDVDTPAQAIEARIAGLSQNLTPKRDLWGKELSNASGLGRFYDALSPAQVREMQPSPIDKEMVRLNHAPQSISKNTLFDGVQANLRMYPQIYDKYVRLAGNELKSPAWGMGAQDFLNSVVTGKSPMSSAYQMMSDDSRRAFITNTINDYRKLAQRQILDDPANAQFTNEIARLKDYHQQGQMPVLQ